MLEIVEQSKNLVCQIENNFFLKDQMLDNTLDSNKKPKNEEEKNQM